MSRERILQKIRSNRPQQSDLPRVDIQENAGDPIQRFTAMAEITGSDVERIGSLADLPQWLKSHSDSGGRIFNLAGEIDRQLIREFTTHVFTDADIVVVSGALGVAENGSVWVPEDTLVERKTPFAAGHLVLVLDSSHIVATMHEAYSRIDLSATGFGVFIAGPSKTADIEQSLVIGAHGPVKSTVIIY